jgi:flagellar hook-length control protein FliK
MTAVKAEGSAIRPADGVSSAKQAGAGGERSASAIRVVGEARAGSTASDALVRGRLKQGQEQSSLRRQSFQAQVGRGLAAALKQKGGVVTLRLKPESMGQVQIKLELNGGRVQATFRAEQSSARDLLSGSLDALRSTLEARGLSVERLQVEPAEETRQEGDREQRDPRGGEGQAGRGDDPDGRPRSGWWSGGSSASASAEPVGRAEGSEARIAEDRDQETRDDELRLDLRVGLDAIA